MELICSKDLKKPKDYEFLTTPLWGKVLYPASLNIVTAHPKAGKSSFLYSWAGQVTQGLEWGDIVPPKSLKVVYWELENPEVIQYNKVNPVANDNFWVSKSGWAEDFDIEKVPKKLQAVGFWPDVLIIDPFVYATNIGKENDAREMVRAIKKFIRFARETRICTILVHHDRKPGADSVGMDDPRHSARGSSALPGAVDMQMNILLGRHHRRLQVTFNRFGSTAEHEPTFILEYDNDAHFCEGKQVID